VKKLIRKILRENTTNKNKVQRFIEVVIDDLVNRTEFHPNIGGDYNVKFPWDWGYVNIFDQKFDDGRVMSWLSRTDPFINHLRERYNITQDLIDSFGEIHNTFHRYGTPEKLKKLTAYITSEYVKRIKNLVIEKKKEKRPEWFDVDPKWKDVEGWDWDDYGEKITSWKDDPALDDDFSYLYESTGNKKLDRITNLILDSIDVSYDDNEQTRKFIIHVSGVIEPDFQRDFYLNLRSAGIEDFNNPEIPEHWFEGMMHLTYSQIQFRIFSFLRIVLKLDDIPNINKYINEIVLPSVSEKIRDGIESYGYRIVSEDDDTINEQYDYSSEKLYSKDYVLRIFKNAPKNIKSIVDNLEVIECNNGECVKLPEFLYVYMKGRY